MPVITYTGIPACVVLSEPQMAGASFNLRRTSSGRDTNHPVVKIKSTIGSVSPCDLSLVESGGLGESGFSENGGNDSELMLLLLLQNCCPDVRFVAVAAAMRKIRWKVPTNSRTKWQLCGLVLKNAIESRQRWSGFLPSSSGNLAARNVNEKDERTQEKF